MEKTPFSFSKHRKKARLKGKDLPRPYRCVPGNHGETALPNQRRNRISRRDWQNIPKIDKYIMTQLRGTCKWIFSAKEENKPKKPFPAPNAELKRRRLVQSRQKYVVNNLNSLLRQG
ncbi:MAG: hypothetical protein KHW91_09390 [Clostridiales bacterium]|nr:hypothetical protein [Clostridiales bacterium]